jgi:hypothetical protein
MSMMQPAWAAKSPLLSPGSIATLANATTDDLLKVVSLIDTLPVRGASDLLIDTVRDRLRMIRPARPFHFTRAVFIPFDPVIVPKDQWQRDTPTLPRNTLAVLAAQLAPAFSEIEMTALKASAEGMGESAQRRLAGTHIWPRASIFFANATVPPDWKDKTGLEPADYTMLTRSISLLLPEAVAIENLVHQEVLGQPPASREIEDMIRRMAMNAAHLHPALAAKAMWMLFALLQARIPSVAETVMMLAGEDKEAGSPPHAALQKAASATLGAIKGQWRQGVLPAPPSLDSARVIKALHLTRGPTFLNGPDHEALADRISDQTDANCRAKFDACLWDHIVGPAAKIGPSTSDSAILALEGLARDVKRLEGIGRKLGGPDHYDQSLIKAAKVLSTPSPGQVGLVERARLVEILLGTEHAISMLTGSGT